MSMKMFTAAKYGVTTLLGASLILTGIAPAHAQETAAEQVAQLVTEVAPDQGTVAEPVVTAEGAVAEASGAEVMVPTGSDAPVEVSVLTDNGARIEAEITLPDLEAAEPAVVTDHGTVVYATEDGSGDAMAVQTLTNGSTRVQTVLGSPDSDHVFGYQMDGYTPATDGEAFFFLGDDGSYVPVDDAWARDANGADVATHYEIRGKKLVQVVVPGPDTVYPVVADPVWVWMWGAYGAKLNRYETSRVIDYQTAFGLCVALIKPKAIIPCGAIGGYMVAQARLANSDRPNKR